MTDRRRNLLVLLLVFGLLVASAVVIATKPTKLGLDLKGGVELNYEATPTRFAQVDSDSIQRAIDIMRQRVDQLGVSEPEIQQSGKNQINVALPDVTNAEEAQRQVGTTAQLFFYDWETNVIGANGKPDPNDLSVTGGPSAGQAGCVPQYDAVIRASRVPAMPQNNRAADGNQFYVVRDRAGTTPGKVLSGPENSAGTATQELPGERLGSGQRVVEVKEGTTLVQQESDTALTSSGPGPDCYYVLNDDFALRGTDIKDPEQNFDNGTGGSGEPVVTFNFTDRGRTIWQRVTRAIAQRGQSFIPSDGTALTPQQKSQHFAIVLDGKLISTPYIDFVQNPDGIDASNGSQIGGAGAFTIKSAQRLANLLKTGALPIRLTLISQSQVSATLGQQALDQGVLALVIGFAVVAIFLIAFYRVLGLVAVFALLLYGVYLFALIKAIPVVLTLPGFAGLVLTIGVCADANIVIFERVKEEVVKGRSVKQSIAQGYKKGLTTIIDANVVTLLTAFVLFVLATSNVRGFALVLGLGTLVTLFSAVLATQAVIGIAGKGLTSAGTVGAREGRKKRQFNFNGYTKYFFSASGIILAAGALAIATKGLEFGIDFSSGTRIEAAFNRPVTNDQVVKALEGAGVTGAEVQRVAGSPQGPNAVQISTSELRPDEVTRVTAQLDRSLGGVRGSPQTQSIGPTFGASIARSAAIAVIVSLLLIGVYIALRFEWKYAATTAISLMHDLLITGGLYAITGREVTSGTVAALLTVLGFSLYDTIIVSDRMRENQPRMPWATFSQISNRSMNEVIVRSLSTVACASLPIIALYFIGGEVLQDFAFALLVGTISGAYSSIFISSPVLTEWKEREPGFRRKRARQIEQFGDVPVFAPERGDIEPRGGSTRAPKPRRITGPEDPERRVSKQEFDQMVADLDVDAPRGATATAEADPDDRKRRAAEAARKADALPEDVVLKDDRKSDGPRKPRNKRHGRPR